MTESVASDERMTVGHLHSGGRSHVARRWRLGEGGRHPHLDGNVVHLLLVADRYRAREFGEAIHVTVVGH